jgi:acyl carrier protein phosphodiesterase
VNYFAHLHLAHLSNTSLTGNLLGDFVKGSRLSYLPAELELGIRLHRKIDSYTDAHPICLGFKAEQTAIRRFAGIGLDVLFDHLLAKQLGGDYTKLCNHFYHELMDEKEQLNNHLPEIYKSKVSAIIEQDWFASYQSEEGITYAIKRTSQRLKRPVQLENIVRWYNNNQQRVDAGFEQIYRDTTAQVEIIKDELLFKIHQA